MVRMKRTEAGLWTLSRDGSLRLHEQPGGFKRREECQLGCNESRHFYLHSIHTVRLRYVTAY